MSQVLRHIVGCCHHGQCRQLSLTMQQVSSGFQTYSAAPKKHRCAIVQNNFQLANKRLQQGNHTYISVPKSFHLEPAVLRTPNRPTLTSRSFTLDKKPLLRNTSRLHNGVFFILGCPHCQLSHLDERGSFNQLIPVSKIRGLQVCVHPTHLGPHTVVQQQNAVRTFSSQKDFTLQNESFNKYLETLIDEYKSYTSRGSGERLTDTQLQRLHFLKPVVAVIDKLLENEADIKELTLLITEGDDKEMTAMIENELKLFREEMKDIEEELVAALVGEELADSNDIVLEVSAGVGGQEAMLFGAELFQMYCNFAHYKGWSIGRLQQDNAEYGGFRQASVEVTGQDVYKHLKHEAGVHRVQRVPKTERQGRMHTSTVTVSVVPQPREIDIVIDAKDLKVETMRASGPGGQSVNTTDSAVRITHLPTGTVAECRQERSQLKNKSIALERLRMRLYQSQLEEQEAKRRATRKIQMGTRGRSEKIRTYNFQQDRVSDHRVKGNVNNIIDFMTGGEGLDELIANLELEEQHSSLRSMVEEFELSRKKNGGNS